MKRLTSMILALAMLFSLCCPAAQAASTPEEALGEVDIYSGGYAMSYLAVNGRVQKQEYTYFPYRSEATGQVKEIPAYCVNPNLYGVPQTVGEGESIQYLATEKASDPKVVGIIANCYPHRGLTELGLDNLYQAYYAGKIALWCYLIPEWDISKVSVAPGLTGGERELGERLLAAVKKIYTAGMAWADVPTPQLTAVPDQETAYPVTVDGKQYYQQIFTLTSDTWVVDYAVNIAFQTPGSVPQGTRITDLDNKDITTITTGNDKGVYQGQFKVLYPAESISGKTGSVQFSLSAKVYKYAVYYAICQETDEYGSLQRYLCDTDPQTEILRSGVSKYSSTAVETPAPSGTPVPSGPPTPTPTPEQEPGELEIVKYEQGTDIPLEGASFEVKGPKGDVIGVFTTGSSGKVTVPAAEEGSYTVREVDPPKYHLLDDEPTKTVTVHPGETARLSFHNQPYGDLRIEKVDGATGHSLAGARIQIKHIETGATYTGETSTGGSYTFTELLPGAYEIQELAAPEGWKRDPQTYTTTVVTGECVSYTLKNDALPGLKITKYDTVTHAAMSKVTFEIFRDTVLLGRYETDAMGEILLTDLQPGTYKVVEVDTGNTTHIIAPPQEVELTAGGGIRELVFLNDQKPGMWLVKVDSADPSKVIPNAVFTVRAVDGSFGPKEFRTNERGEIDLSALPAGSYEVLEKSCEGYIIDEAQRIIHLEANQTARFVFTNTIKPSLNLIKLSSDGSRLAGVTFRIAKMEDGTHYLDRTTNAQGEILISDLESGVYSVKETATLDDHIIDLREYHVELFPGKTSTIIIENQKRPNLTVYKRDADTGEPVANTIFLVKAADGHSVNEIKTGTDGKAVLENLLPGVYEISEKSVPAPWLMDAKPQLVTLYPNRDRTVHFENHKAPTIEIIKEDSITHDRLANVRFQVWYASNHTSTGELNDLGVFTTDENGRIELTGPDNGLRDGWFRVKELAPPKGYSIKDSDTQEAFVQAGKSYTFRFENQPLSAIIVYKYDEKTTQALEGAEFEIKYLGGTSGTGGTSIGTFKTSSNGTFTVTGLQAGTYVISETRSSPYYSIDTTPQTVYLSGKDQDVVTVRFGNQPYGTVLIKKLSDDSNKAPLEGAVFLVTDDKGAFIGNANGEYTTGKDGSIQLPKLPGGTTVVAREIRAPEGYALDSTPQTVYVQPGEVHSLTFYNKPLCNFTLLKRDSVTKEPLKNAEFTVTDAEGKAIGPNNGRYITGTDGTFTITGLEPNSTIVIAESKAPAGYVLDKTPRTQVVKSGAVNSMVVDNEPTTTLILRKYIDGTDYEPLAGVCFKVTDGSGAAIGPNDGIYYSDKAGEAVITGLEPGTTVIAREIKTVDGFVLDGTPQDIVIKGGEVQNLTFWNKRAGGLIVNKVDAVTKKPLAGVQFKITYADGSNVDQDGGKTSTNGIYKTDTNGQIIISGITGAVIVTEVETIPGYIIDPDTKSQTIVINPQDTQTITFTNTPTQTLVIQKLVAETKDRPLAGVEFLVTDSSGTFVGPNNGIYRTDKYGRITISGLEPGTVITAKETKTLEGYILDSTPQSIEIKSGSVQTLTFYNTPFGGVEIIKVNEADRTQRIPGVTFEIRRVKDQGLVDTVTTGDKGRVYATLDAGDYYLVELECPKEFKCDPTPHYFTVEDGKTATMTVTNKPFSGVIIHKVDSVTGEGLYNVKFLVYDENKDPIGEYSTDNEGYIYARSVP